MKRTLFLMLLLFAVQSAAREGSDKNSFRIFGQYGFAQIYSSQFNNAIAATSNGSTKMTSETFYGGGLGLKLGPKVETALSFEQHGGYIYNGGPNYNVTQDVIWGGFNYYFLRQDDIAIYIGAYTGYPAYTHLTYSNSPTGVRDYNADKWVCAMGDVGGVIYLGNHFSVFVEVGYQQLSQGTFKDSSGNSFAAGPNTNVGLDLNGARFLAGGSIIF